MVKTRKAESILDAGTEIDRACEALGKNLAGMEAVVVGRSNIVGKPMAQLLLRESCTVTVAHSRTRNLPDVVRRADIVVAAVGRRASIPLAVKSAIRSLSDA